MTISVHARATFEAITSSSSEPENGVLDRRHFESSVVQYADCAFMQIPPWTALTPQTRFI